ncbi:transcriptional regulator [Oceanobacillus iheyensis HTE831]|uniref:Transcriptional regulator n=1 Tax=Oceanobacillus iheyensis (strain DSM 14371 / CIP 107618 / JCM 11309 / KCTC 3954 / HTE831) TaxID=221109 RepID=Q8EME0_OCEIH|nr:LCP family protein [Oceanobacillus iheyensis]BAC14865.1 transcriptional regulator [Oceanobacillus iheyensis HTE831]
MKKNKSVPTRTVMRKKKKRKIRKRVLFILLPIAIVFFGVLGYGVHLYVQAQNAVSNSYEDEGREKSALRENQVDPNIDNVSILIIGTDANEHRDNADNARSDALMLATFNKSEESVNLVSIPRDSYVHIPEVGRQDKITHAHAYGGPKATIETVENLMDIPVDYYVRVDFHAFVDVVDAIGGINVDVPYEFKESNSMDKRDAIHLLAGEQTVNGEEALALARTRKLDNDIERGKRQMEILNAVAKKAASVNSVFNFDDVINAVGDNMSTNMSFKEMRTFVSYVTGGLKINNSTLEGSDYQPGSTYYWQLDEVALQETKSMLQEHLEISNPTVNTDAESYNETNETQESQDAQNY